MWERENCPFRSSQRSSSASSQYVPDTPDDLASPLEAPMCSIMGCFLHKNQIRFQQGHTYQGGDRVHDTSFASYPCRCCSGGTDCIRPRADPGQGARTDCRCCQPGSTPRGLPRSLCVGLSSWPQFRRCGRGSLLRRTRTIPSLLGKCCGYSRPGNGGPCS